MRLALAVLAGVLAAGCTSSHSPPLATFATAQEPTTVTQAPTTQAATTTVPVAAVGSTLNDVPPGGTTLLVSFGPGTREANTFTTAKPGTSLVVAVVKVCSVTANVDMNPLNFKLILDNHNGIDVALGSVGDRQLSTGTISTGDCSQGEVPFEVPSGNRGIALEEDAGGGGARLGSWAL
jgi:hypothetical protein